MFIAELFAALELAAVEYAVVGGVAVNIHGVPRMTYDVRVAAIDDLIRMKRAAHRPQDLADIAHLERIGTTR